MGVRHNCGKGGGGPARRQKSIDVGVMGAMDSSVIHIGANGSSRLLISP